MDRTIFAVDPGNNESAFVVVLVENEKIKKVVATGKVENKNLLFKTEYYATAGAEIVIEMIASYGMPVGKSVFETCVCIGRIIETARHSCADVAISFIYRKDEKIEICGTMKAKDANIRQALIDKYAPDIPNKGKGTKNNPGFFHGFADDMWQAFAVAETYLSKTSRGEILEVIN